VLLDYNCGASDDAQVIEQVRQVRARSPTWRRSNSPTPVGNVVDSARLGEQLGVALSIDEGVRSLRDVAQIVRYRAAEIICVKPARVGGLANARTIILRAREAGLRAYVGGFFESPYARSVHQSWRVTASTSRVISAPSEVVTADYSREVDAVPVRLWGDPVARDARGAAPFWWTCNWRFRLSP